MVIVPLFNITKEFIIFDSLLRLKGYLMLKVSPLTDFRLHDRTWNLFALVFVEEQEVV